MGSLTITIKQAKNRPKKILIEMDVEKLERLIAALGLFSPDFLKSVDQAEKDYKAGKIRKIKSLKELRK